MRNIKIWNYLWLLCDVEDPRDGSTEKKFEFGVK